VGATLLWPVPLLVAPDAAAAAELQQLACELPGNPATRSNLFAAAKRVWICVDPASCSICSSDIAACRAAFRRGLIQAPTRGSRPILLIKISRFSLLYPFYVFRLFYDYLPASAWPSTPGQISQYLYAPGGCGRLATCSPHPSGQLFRSINHQRCAIAAGSAL